MNKGKKKSVPTANRRLIATLAVLCAVAMVAGWLLDRAGLASLGGASRTGLHALRISEAQNHNVLTLRDENGDVPGWIELENTGDVALSLKGVCLTRDEKLNKTLVFPDIALEPGDFLLIMADGGSVAWRDGRLHAPFRLHRSGGTLGDVDDDDAATGGLRQHFHEPRLLWRIATAVGSHDDGA